jgi:hypothetical protein
VNVRTWFGRALAVTLCGALPMVTVPQAQAAPHVVSSQMTSARLLDNAKSREQKIRLFEDALAQPEVQRQARAMGANADKLRAAIPHLSDKELTNLAERARNVKDVAAGHHDGGGDAGLLILGLALLIAAIVILAVVVDEDYWEDDCYYDDCW